MPNAALLDDTVLNALRDQAEERADLASLWLYGSRARGAHHAQSDYDIAVAFTDWQHDPLERRLRPELMALDWQATLGLPENALSIVDIAIAPIPLAWTIISDGILLWDRNPSLRMQQESRIMSRWEIDYLHSRKHYD
ncbi:nucleotidyltransferase domain-containing protein [Chromohalobacter salexigens]|uniref:type VII toxin-antitoxin system MntA family adenylyltransferase antitoxin n=1 Tax=Chromohalobacter japonicus TaxID=223900 RepID=UPI0009FA2C9E|nr:nucleotidyltransferase domain-containing protein [Chromohalobacter japonicus]NWO11519.1 nucleotidyltransferase domain-containing protein [Chromohalobacter salexigens]